MPTGTIRLWGRRSGDRRRRAWCQSTFSRSAFRCRKARFGPNPWRPAAGSRGPWRRPHRAPVNRRPRGTFTSLQAGPSDAHDQQTGISRRQPIRTWSTARGAPGDRRRPARLAARSARGRHACRRAPPRGSPCCWGGRSFSGDEHAYREDDEHDFAPHVPAYPGGGSLAGALPGLAFAAPGRGRQRLVLVILRGGLDGLAAVAPYGDPDYERSRGGLALGPPGGRQGAHDLDGFFALHPMLETLHGRYLDGELAVFHAVATPYRKRSHFDAQNVLELGLATPHASHQGWLNRCLPMLAAGGGNPPQDYAMAIGQALPLVLRGPESAASWAPARLPGPGDDLLDRLRALRRRRLPGTASRERIECRSHGRRRYARAKPAR